MSSMRLEHATAFLYALKPRGIRFGLENTRLVLQRLGNPQKRLEMGVRGRARAENEYSQEKMVAAYANLYREMVKEVK